MGDKLIITWNEFGELLDILCNDIEQSNYKFNYVVAIPRGGLSIGQKISHYFKVPLLTNISNHLVDRKNKYLVVDDISDTGATLLNFADNFNRRIMFRTAVLHLKVNSRYIPHFVASNPVIDNDCWILYPWEDNNCNPVEEQQNHLRRTMMLCETNGIKI